MKDNLLIVWTNGDIEVAKNNPQIQEQLTKIQNTGVKMSACIVCVEDYDAISILKKLNIEITHTGELLTKALKDETWSVMAI